MSKIKRFIESIEVPNTKKVVRHVLEGESDEIGKYDVKELEAYILSKRPSSPKSIVTICYILGLYSRWLQEDGDNTGVALEYALQEIDKKALWNKAKPNAKQKFVSQEQFLCVVNDIKRYEEFNELYYRTLWGCIYEGIYNDDMSVLKNLRKSHIVGNTVILREDSGHTYTLMISEGLASDLLKLSDIEVWQRKNRFGVCRVQMRGLYEDSVFKIEERKRKQPSSEESYKFTFYAKLRKICDEYLDFNMLPFQLYISGMMYRIIRKLHDNDILVEDAFSERSRNKAAYEIITEELKRCNYTSEVSNFREIVKGHLHIF